MDLFDPANDKRNIRDEFKGWAIDLITNELDRTYTGIDVVMINFDNDFNFASALRSANNFGVRNMYYGGGRRRYDKRGAVGVYHYTEPIWLGSTTEEIHTWFCDIRKEKHIIMLENAIGLAGGPEPLDITTFVWPTNPLLVIGSESLGIPQEFWCYGNSYVEIPSLGSVRSINVAQALSIALYDFIAKKEW